MRDKKKDRTLIKAYLQGMHYRLISPSLALVGNKAIFSAFDIKTGLVRRFEIDFNKHTSQTFILGYSSEYWGLQSDTEYFNSIERILEGA